MSLVKVWNDNEHPHTERFKGKEISIPPHAYVEMDYLEGVEFKAQFTEPRRRGDGTFDPKFYKMIRVDQPKDPIFVEERDHATGSRLDPATITQAVAAGMAQVAASGADSARIANLEAQLIQLKEALEAKRGPGRPPKGAA